MEAELRRKAFNGQHTFLVESKKRRTKAIDYNSNWLNDICGQCKSSKIECHSEILCVIPLNFAQRACDFMKNLTVSIHQVSTI